MTPPRLALRLVICSGDVPIGPRFTRKMPMPVYQPTYEMTPEGEALANYHLERLQKYVDEHFNER